MGKTATKTLDELIDEFNSKPYGVSLEKFIYDYFYIHRSAQQLSEYKEVIQGLLPIAEFGYSVMNVNHPTLAEAKDIINRAKALLQESNQAQPPQESEQP